MQQRFREFACQNDVVASFFCVNHRRGPVPLNASKVVRTPEVEVSEILLAFRVLGIIYL